jgi:hypothetical protein
MVPGNCNLDVALEVYGCKIDDAAGYVSIINWTI